MSSHTAVCVEAHEPTAVTHAVTAFLTPSDGPSLVLARQRYLDVYSVIGGRLEKVYCRRLHGIIESLAVLNKRGSASAILLTSRDAKVSVLRWNASTFELECSSLHYFEGDVSLKAGRVCFPSGPFCAVDPAGRCAAIIMFRHQIAVLPTMSDSSSLFPNIESNDLASFPSTVVGNSYVDKLGSIRCVRDAVFLHGTNEPTLLCLHEGAGGNDDSDSNESNIAITALSINIESKKHPKVWEVVGLPSDAYKLSAAPDGGALVLTGTSVLYLNQRQKSGVTLHSEGVASTEPIPPLEFDPSKEPISATVRTFAESFANNLPPTSSRKSPSYCDITNAHWNIDCSCASITWLEDTMALVSFRYGDLVTMRIVDDKGTRKIVANKVASGPQPTCMVEVSPGMVFLGSRGGDSLLLSWKSKQNSGGVEGPENPEDGIVEELAEERENLVKRARTSPEEVFADYQEDLLSIFGESLGATITSAEVDLDVLDSITSLGAMRKLIAVPPLDENGMQSFVGCCGTGTNGALVILQRGLVADIITTIPLLDLSKIWVLPGMFLLLAFSNRSSHHTRVLSAAGDLGDVTSATEFLHEVETISAGVLENGNQYQVHKKGVRLLAQGKKALDFTVDGDVAKAAAAGDLLALAMADGSGQLYGDQGGGFCNICSLPSTVHGKRAKICSMDVYFDSNGWLSDCLSLTDAENDKFFVWICYDNGEIAVCHISKSKNNELVLLWCGNGLAAGVDVICRESDDVVSRTDKYVANFRVKRFENTTYPLLVASNDSGAVFCYRLFKGVFDAGSLSLKRLRLPLPVISSLESSRCVDTFDRIGEECPFSGFFVSGQAPLWLIVNRGNVFVHESTQAALGTVASFSPFNNENCPNGFLAVTEHGLTIANFAPRMKLDAQWPRRKLGIKSVPVDCAYYPEAKLLALTVLAPGAPQKFLPEDGEGEAQAAYAYALASLERRVGGHEVRLVNPASWRVLWSHQLLPGENSLCVTAVHLKDQSSEATIPLLAVGTSFAAGEDYPCSGRVILIKVLKGDDGSFQGEIIFSREFKGPITNIASVEGYLLLSTGNRLETCTLKSSQDTYTLQRSAFFEGPSLITSLNVVKNFILIGDTQHSVQFLRYKDQGKQIMSLSKDFGQACVRTCQFLIAGSSLHILMADGEGNFKAFTYSPNDPKSWKGQKLENWGALHVGKGISNMLRVPMQLGQSSSSKSSGAVCVTDLGGILMVMPLLPSDASGITEFACESLGNALSSSVYHVAGLNPLAFRRRYQKSLLSLQGSTFYDNPPPLFQQGIIDGDLFEMYLQESTGFQQRLAVKLGFDALKVASVCQSLRDVRIEQ
jgi:cleavage and polyadenylation specificity factor subunit 1